MSIKTVNDDSPQSVGLRLQRLRMMAGIEQSALAEEADVSKTSISYWETGRSNIKSDNLRKVINVFRRHGVEIDEHWLLHGIGITPRLTFHMGESGASYHAHTPVLRIAAFESELKLFLTYRPSAIILKIENNNFSPTLYQGDYIGCEWHVSTEFLVPNFGIIEESNLLSVRYMIPDSDAGYFRVYSSMNIDSSIEPRLINRIGVLLRLWRN